MQAEEPKFEPRDNYTQDPPYGDPTVLLTVEDLLQYLEQSGENKDWAVKDNKNMPISVCNIGNRSEVRAVQ